MHCISERKEHMAVANTHVEDLCVGGVATLLNDMAKLTLSDADLTVLTAFVRKRLVANVCRIMIYGHMHCIDTCPLSLTHTHPPESSRTHYRCQNRRISGRGSRTVRLRRMVTGGRGHDVLLRFGPS